MSTYMPYVFLDFLLTSAVNRSRTCAMPKTGQIKSKLASVVHKDGISRDL